MGYYVCVFFFKQKTAYEMRISDWSSDVCSSDLTPHPTSPRRLCRQGFVSFSRKGRRRCSGGPVGRPFSWEWWMTDQLEASFDVVAQGERLAGLENEVAALRGEIGRASCRERVCQYV